MKINSEKGIALLLVLWILILLSVMAGEFSHTMRTEMNITRNFRDETQAYYLAEAGIYQAIFEIIRNEINEKQTGKTEENHPWRINTDIEPISFAEGQFQVRIDNESGKIDLNAADETILKLLLGRFAIDDHQKNSIIDSVQDWRDTDHFHRPDGAESEYYQSLSEPYACKNADFDSVEELLLVRGVTQDIFDGLKEMLTVYRGDSLKDRNAVFGGGGYRKEEKRRKVNINAASAEMLRILPLMTEGILQKITEYRKSRDFDSEEEIKAVLGPGIQGALMSYITVEKSAFFTITSVGKVSDSEVVQAIQALVEIDPAMDKKFRIVRWTDRYDPDVRTDE